ncbi:uncharacterized protein LOC115634278 [Scaptodrosophila lebanonensis]|uniref:Uncharacterized protein LOC115634278 n=1 Tax=Drosophila lebanonensis TaxID=7225 RepID=A0A6J2UH31_DROLE|nr:uncharacterized protein LOC115634278 [Scaptodrosophila lebanonensis]
MEKELHHRPIIRSKFFPKPLPPLQPGPVYDDIGFTLSERLALKQAWFLLKPYERRHGTNVFYTFLVEHYRAINRFRTPNMGINLHGLHTHAVLIMRFFGALIEGLNEDTGLFHMLMTDHNTLHKRCGVASNDVYLLGVALKEHILKILRNVSSVTLERGLQKIIDKFRVYHMQLKPKGKTRLKLSHGVSAISLKN